MNRLILAFCISVMLHLIGVLCLRHLRFAEGLPIKAVEVFLPEPAASVRPAPIDLPAKRGGSEVLRRHDENAQSPFAAAASGLKIVAVVDAAAVDSAQVDSAVVDSTRDLNPIDFFTQSSALPLFEAEASNEQRYADTLGFGKNSLFFGKGKNNQLFLGRPGPFDKAEMEIDKHNMGGERPVSLSDAVRAGSEFLSKLQQKKEKEKPVRLDFIPSKTELEVLSAVWRQPKLNDIEIYASMDSSVRVTAEDLQHILEVLVQKRLLTRKLTSPRNEFTLPFGGTVEMSAQNLRNRVYEYQARIQADEVICYLNSLLYELEHRAGARTPTYEKRVSDLKEKILLTGR
jgi:hypothetical protein